MNQENVMNAISRLVSVCYFSRGDAFDESQGIWLGTFEAGRSSGQRGRDHIDQQGSAVWSRYSAR
jgi:hypothetical protein